MTPWRFQVTQRRSNGSGGHGAYGRHALARAPHEEDTDVPASDSGDPQHRTHEIQRDEQRQHEQAFTSQVHGSSPKGGSVDLTSKLPSNGLHSQLVDRMAVGRE